MSLSELREVNQLAWYAEQDIRLALKRARSWVRKLKKAADDFMSESIVYADLVHPADLLDVETELEETGKEGGRKFVKEYKILTGLGDMCGLKKRLLSSATRKA
ncbi:MAG: hypothetical protein K8R13_04245 [Methanococcoides sp.]|nr:hypothetical protein [Methanococcoides sp.]